MRKDLRFYIISIFVLSCAFFVVNYYFAPVSIWLNAWGVFGGVVVVITIDGVCAAVCHKFLGGLNPLAAWFRVGKREKALWRALGVRHFKELLPDLGTLVKFPKGKVVDKGSPDYLRKYLVESCIGEIGHISGIIFGCLVIFMMPLDLFLFFGLPIIITNFVFSFMPIMALRYNRYTLLHLYQKLMLKITMDSKKTS